MVLFCAALLWISTASQETLYAMIAAQMVVLGIGMRVHPGAATDAIMGAVPKQKAGIASAVNGATRLFGGTLGVAVIGSVAVSLDTSRLIALLPAGLPGPAITAARGPVGGAVAAAEQLSRAGLADPAHALSDAAVLAFLHSLASASLVAAGITAIGALLVAFWLPAHPAPSRPTLSGLLAACRQPVSTRAMNGARDDAATSTAYAPERLARMIVTREGWPRRGRRS